MSFTKICLLLSFFADLQLNASLQLETLEVYKDTSVTAEARAKDVLAKLSFEEKVELTGGSGMLAPGIKKLGLTQAKMADASQGVRLYRSGVDADLQIDLISGVVGDSLISVSFPGMLAMAATWNTDLADQFGNAMGEQCRALGIDVLLGPGINMYRTSAGGRAYEYMGEDPYLTSQMVINYINGVQRNGVIATAKHFVCNDQEFCRHFASSEVDMRTMREIYLAPFRAAVKEANVGAIMTGNNRVNGLPAPIHKPLMEDVVRDEWGFKGITMSDWQETKYYTKDHPLVLESGHSLYMPSSKMYRKWLLAHYQNQTPKQQKILEKQLDGMVIHNLIPLFESGFFDRGSTEAAYSPIFEEHRKIAKKTAEEAFTLLKNEDDILPVKKGMKILYIGKKEIYTGIGSGKVIGYNNTTYQEGLQKIYGTDLTIRSLEDVSENDYKAADVVIYNVNKNGGETRDIPFDLPAEQTQEIEEVLDAHPNVILLLTACNGFNMPWLSKVKGVIWCYFLGQERGDALAHIINGKINPSGKLPMTIEKDFSDSVDPKFNYLGGQPFWRGSNIYRDYIVHGIQPKKGPKDFMEIFVPNVQPGEILKVAYEEGIHMGYKWYDKQKITPQFPFGYGLSYTTFDYQKIKLIKLRDNKFPVHAVVTIKNTGQMRGKETIQVYVTDDKSSVPQVSKELAGFTKIELKPGEVKDVMIPLHWTGFQFFDTKTNSWVLEPGEFIVRAGGSSAELPLSAAIEF